MASDIDVYRRTPPCALHRTFKKKFHRPNYSDKPVSKPSAAAQQPKGE